MKPSNLQLFQQEIHGFFFLHFSDFKLYEPVDCNKNYIYYHNYPAMKLSIIVCLPLIINHYGQLEMTDRKVDIALKKTGNNKRPYLVELIDTNLTTSWQDRIKKRIAVLQELVAEIHKCKNCDVFKLPQVSQTNDLKHTIFRIASMPCLPSVLTDHLWNRTQDTATQDPQKNTPQKHRFEKTAKSRR